MNKVFKNASWIIGCRIVQAIFALAINMITARYLGPSNYGIITYAASMVNFLTPLMNLGLNETLVGEILQYPDEEGKTMGTSMLISFISSIFCIIGLVFFVYFVNAGETETLIVCFLYSLLLCAKSFEMLHYWFQAKLMSKYVSLATLFAYIVISLYKVFLLITNKSIYWFAISNSIDYFLIACILLFFYYKNGGQKLEPNKQTAIRVMRRSFPYILPGIISSFYAQSDKVMLKLMIDNFEVGVYSAAYSIAGLSSFVFSALIESMKSYVIKRKEECDIDYKNYISILFGMIIIISLLQAIFVSFFSKYIILIMYGENYIEAINVLKIVIWYTIFSYYGAARNVWIFIEQKQKYLWTISLFGMFANIGLNLLLIPNYGAKGAAVATLLTQLFMNVILNFFVKELREVNILAYKGLNPFYLINEIKKRVIKNDR